MSSYYYHIFQICRSLPIITIHNFAWANLQQVVIAINIQEVMAAELRILKGTGAMLADKVLRLARRGSGYIETFT